jgi:3-keto-disaccharide hydrolase
MRTLTAALTLTVLPISAPSQSRLPEMTSSFQGRWDLVVTMPDGSSSPRWMDYLEGRDPLIRIQPKGGSVHPAYDPNVDGPHITLIVDKATDKSPATTWDLRLKNNVITGTQKTGDVIAQIKGVKAPELKHDPPRVWTKAEPLFNGKDLTGWEPIGATVKNNWIAQEGALVNADRGANLRTTRTFDDFKLHIEFNCPENGNSGIYLRGRYEVQIEYEKVDANDPLHSIGSIYGFLAPGIDLPRKPGTWESFDVTLVGRYLTIVRNGKKTIDNREIPGITGGALDSNEAETGPFYLQGDHTGGMKYRNITIQLPRTS